MLALRPYIGRLEQAHILHLRLLPHIALALRL